MSDEIEAFVDRGALERGLLVGFTNRRGGVSAAPYDSLNLAARVGDDLRDVEENRRRAATALGFDVATLALARQVHGAEVLSARVRRRIEPKKGGPEAWLDVHREAHRRGFKSTATMMYGHVEDAEDVLDHFDAIRALQDEFGGFTAFVPWSFKPNNTLLEKWIKQHKGPNAYLRMLAASRLYLDNFPHVQASWFSEGKRAGQIALHFGADDWGGTLFEENVHRAAAYVNTITVEEIVTLIREAGFTPAQRDTEYEILKSY